MKKLNYFEKTLLVFYGAENYKKIRSIKIGIAGCGGLGSNCAFNLVRAGFRKFTIVDFDKIEFTNLNRQFYFYSQVGKSKAKILADNLKQINPAVKIKPLQLKLTEKNILKTFEDCDIVVEAFDKVRFKRITAEKIIPTGKFLVSASGVCGIGKSDDIRTHIIKPNFILVGDLKTCSSKQLPISPRVNIAAAKQADAILEHVLNAA